jgi:hypothetical protein
MRSTMLSSLVLLTLIAADASRFAIAQDTALSLVVNPRTGAASIRNDSTTSVSIDGYLLTSGTSVFNPAGWSKLTGNASYPGWEQGPAAANRLGEGNLFSSLGLSGGTSLSLGSPYLPLTPTQIGQLEPAVTFAYHVAAGATVIGDVVFAPQNNVVLLINPVTGAASLQNQSLFNVNIDGLLIKSPAHVLDPVGWQGLAESGVAGWTMGASETNRLGEGNLFNSTLLPASGTPVPIGTPINELLIEDETDLTFEYHVAGGESLSGGVVFLASAATPLAGDYNGNGSVDAADYTIWRNTLGSMSDLRANGNNSGPSMGKIDQADYIVWKTNFGAGGSGAGAATAALGMTSVVPEPAACLIGCTIGLVLVGACRVRFETS